MDRENDLLKEAVEYRTWLGRLNAHQLRNLAAEAGVRDWLSLSTDNLVDALKEHGKAQTIWARMNGVFDGEKTRSQTSGSHC